MVPFNWLLLCLSQLCWLCCLVKCWPSFLLATMFHYWFCWELFYLFSSALFHDCLALSFWLSVPIIARMGSLFYVTISVDSVLLSFPKLVKIHNVIWLGISKFCSSWIYCWAEIYRKQIIHGWLWPRRAYHPLAIANIYLTIMKMKDPLLLSNEI